MSIDTIVESSFFNSADKVKQLSLFCSFPSGVMYNMTEDDSLFTKEEGAAGNHPAEVEAKVKTK